MPVCISIIYRTGQLSLRANTKLRPCLPVPLWLIVPIPPCPRPRPLGPPAQRDMLMPTPAGLLDRMAPNSSILGKLHCIPRAFHWLRLVVFRPLIWPETTAPHRFIRQPRALLNPAV
ncbi:hypothetical protein J3F83DRAFT_719781 [Trichoderma novae-zelandiae]